MRPTLIRAASLEDYSAIGRVHVRSWRTTYRGLLHESILARQSVEQGTALWRREIEKMLEGRSASMRVWVL